jgi:PIN domain nuclease of toxin-antitoxin system
MRLLLDTHSFLWVVEDSPRLSRSTKAPIEDPSNDIFLSIASPWEMAIKVSLGKLYLGQPTELFVPQQLHLNEILILGVSVEHVAVVATLPFHHRDPFDRMLIAQARVESMPIVSADPLFDAYGTTRLW